MSLQPFKLDPKDPKYKEKTRDLIDHIYGKLERVDRVVNTTTEIIQTTTGSGGTGTNVLPIHDHTSLSQGGVITSDYLVALVDNAGIDVALDTNGKIQLTDDGIINADKSAVGIMALSINVSAILPNTVRIDHTDSPYTMLSTDQVVFADTDGGAITINLLAGSSGKWHKIINCGSASNDVTVDPNGTEQLYKGGAGVSFALKDGENIDIHFNVTEGWW